MDKNKIIQAATKFVQKGQFDKAIQEYQKILKEDPKDVRILLKVGELFQKKGDNALAARTLLQVAESYSADGFFLKAVAVYKQILKLDPALLEVNLKLAELYQQLGLMSDAMAQYQLVIAQYEKVGDTGTALEVLRRMVELDPDNVASRIKLAETHARDNRIAEAIDEFRRAADYLKSNNRADDYIKVAERIVYLDPNDLGLSRELANVYLAKGDTKRALAKLQICFKADPKDVETLHMLAQAFKDLGQLTKTVSVYKELAKIFSEADRFDEEKAIWRKVLEVAPEDPDARAALAPRRMASAGPGPEEFIHAQGPRNRAPEPAAAPVASPPPRAAPPAPPKGAGRESIPKLLTETDVYVKYGLQDKALEHLRKVFAIDPENVDGHEKALELYTKLNNHAAIIEQLVKIAQLCVRVGDVARGQPHFARLMEQAPHLPEVGALMPHYGATAHAPEDESLLVESRDDEVLVAGGEDEQFVSAADDESLLGGGGDDEALLAVGGGDDDALVLDPSGDGGDISLEVPDEGEQGVVSYEEAPGDELSLDPAAAGDDEAFAEVDEEISIDASDIEEEGLEAAPAETPFGDVDDAALDSAVEAAADAAGADDGYEAIEEAGAADDGIIAIEDDAAPLDPADAEAAEQPTQMLSADSIPELAALRAQWASEAAAAQKPAAELPFEAEPDESELQRVPTRQTERHSAPTAVGQLSPELLAAASTPEETAQPWADEDDVAPPFVGDDDDVAFAGTPGPRAVPPPQPVVEDLSEAGTPGPAAEAMEEGGRFDLHEPPLPDTTAQVDLESAEPPYPDARPMLEETPFEETPFEEPRAEPPSFEEAAAAAEEEAPWEPPASEEPAAQPWETEAEGEQTGPVEVPATDEAPFEPPAEETPAEAAAFEAPAEEPAWVPPAEEAPAEAAATEAPAEEPAAEQNPWGLEPEELEEIQTELEEADFLFSQELWDEAEEALRSILFKAPGHTVAEAKLAEIEQRRAGVAPEPPAVAEEPAAAPADDERFDLGAELAEELAGAPGESAGTEDEFQYSAEDVFEEFKKGVQRTVRPEDSATHYDLGIAYREMSLHRDAIGEFEVALGGYRGHAREVDCLSMIGVCRAELGELHESIASFKEALRCAQASHDTIKALNFEVALVFEKLDDGPEALYHYEKSASIDATFRDVKKSIDRLVAAGVKAAKHDEAKPGNGSARPAGGAAPGDDPPPPGGKPGGAGSKPRKIGYV